MPALLPYGYSPSSFLLDEEFLEPSIEGNQERKEEIISPQNVKGDLQLRREGNMVVKRFLANRDEDPVEVA